jgi:hypothetical protein
MFWHIHALDPTPKPLRSHPYTRGHVTTTLKLVLSRRHLKGGCGFGYRALGLKIST